MNRSNKTISDQFKDWCKDNGVDFKSTSVERHAMKRAFQVWCILYSKQIRRSKRLILEIESAEKEIAIIYGE